MEKVTFITKKFLDKSIRKLTYEEAIDEIRKITRNNKTLTIRQLIQSIEFFRPAPQKKQRYDCESKSTKDDQ